MYVCLYLDIHSIMNEWTHVAVEMGLRSYDMLTVNICSMCVMNYIGIYITVLADKGNLYKEGFSCEVYNKEFI